MRYFVAILLAALAVAVPVEKRQFGGMGGAGVPKMPGGFGGAGGGMPKMPGGGTSIIHSSF
jgi:hypothetical protein